MVKYSKFSQFTPRQRTWSQTIPLDSLKMSSFGCENIYLKSWIESTPPPSKLRLTLTQDIPSDLSTQRQNHSHFLFTSSDLSTL